MKKYLVFVLGLVIFACSQQSGFKIDVALEGAEGQLILEEKVAGEWNTLDTADIVDGVAQLKGEVACPGAYYLSVAGQRAKTLVFVENAKMSIKGKVDSLDFVQVSGSSTHNEFEGVNKEIKKVNAEYMALYHESRAAKAEGDSEKAKSLMDKVNVLYESVGKMQEDFIVNNPASYVSPYFLSRTQYGKEVEELEALVNKLDPKLNEVQALKDIKNSITKLKTVAVGQIAPDFSQNNADGEPIQFSEIYSKSELTLIDFWASWCGPCRSENPNVVAVFNDYKSQGFNVFGVSLDKDKAAWQKAITDDKLAWGHVSDLAYWQNAAAQLYAINSIPSNLLVDKNGKIIAKNKTEEELRKVVAEYFESKP